MNNEKTAIEKLIEAIHKEDENGDSIDNLFEKSRSSYEEEANKYWDNLSYDEKLMAFYSVCKRIHKGDIVDRGSYRHVLYEIFKFDFDSYTLGMDCGYMDIHNSIISPEDFSLLNIKNDVKKVNEGDSKKSGN